VTPDGAGATRREERSGSREAGFGKTYEDVAREWHGHWKASAEISFDRDLVFPRDFKPARSMSNNTLLFAP
jgi:hypothetical protein